jgi:polysaccharide pyruvyl transferase WcaK-like protein
MFSGWFSGRVVCPGESDKYFQLVSHAIAVVSGRLHTAALALSLGIPFVLLDLDYRTKGFIQTYSLNHATVSHRSNFRESLFRQMDDLLASGNREAWTKSILIRDELYLKAQNRLAAAFKDIENGNHETVVPNVLRCRP